MEKELECEKCGYSWIYTGKSRIYATCPDCKNSVPIEKERKCKICDSEENLHRHHISYENDETIDLCADCHREVHQNPEHEFYPKDKREHPRVITIRDEDLASKLRDIANQNHRSLAGQVRYWIKTHKEGDL